MENLDRISAVSAHFLLRIFGADSSEVLLQLLIFLIFCVVGWYIRPVSMRIRFIRGILRHEEKFSGNYIQIIQNDGERRYSLISISYHPQLKRYVLTGKQYDTDGRPAVEFKSDRVLIVEEIDNTIEFSWRGAANFTKERYEGYTKMTMTDEKDIEMLDGNGFFITFDEPPRRVNLQFLKMTKSRLAQFGLIWPRYGSDNTSFVISFHGALQLHPELEPVEESKRPIII